MRRLKQKETLWALADQTQGELLELYRTLSSPLAPDEVSRNNAIQFPLLLM